MEIHLPHSTKKKKASIWAALFATNYSAVSSRAPGSCVSSPQSSGAVHLDSQLLSLPLQCQTTGALSAVCCSVSLTGFWNLSQAGKSRELFSSELEYKMPQFTITKEGWRGILRMPP